jgi:hypothetical protein
VPAAPDHYQVAFELMARSWWCHAGYSFPAAPAIDIFAFGACAYPIYLRFIANASGNQRPRPAEMPANVTVRSI